MFNVFYNILRDAGFESGMAEHIVEIIFLVLLLLFACLCKNIADKILKTTLLRTTRNKKYKWHNALVKSRFFKRLTHIIPLILLYSASPFFRLLGNMMRTGLNYYIILIILMSIMAVLTAVTHFYNTLDVAKKRPIKGLIQIVKIIIYCITAIVIIAHLLGKSPLAVLGSIGAFTAVLMLIFQDAIVGFVAGVQIASNDMVRIGDSIDMPKYNANGEVVDISLTTIKVENFDNTMTTVPTKAFISDSFRNWRRVKDKGARRIKRSIQININSIDFCTKTQLEKFKKINFISDYIKTKELEIKEYNKENNVGVNELANGRSLTNIGVFRIYVQNYLKNNEFIRKDMSILVHQLDPVENGLPIEVYAFTTATDWEEYEKIQDNIFDHIIAIAPQFDLEIYQSPSGSDIIELLASNKK